MDTLAVMFGALLLFHLHAWLIVSDVHDSLHANNPLHLVSLSQESVGFYSSQLSLPISYTSQHSSIYFRSTDTC